MEIQKKIHHDDQACDHRPAREANGCQEHQAKKVLLEMETMINETLGHRTHVLGISRPINFREFRVKLVHEVYGVGEMCN